MMMKQPYPFKEYVVIRMLCRAKAAIHLAQENALLLTQASHQRRSALCAW